MLKRLILIVGLGAALVGSVYLAKIATQDRMLDTQGWTTSGYALTPD
jgi:hypothetical protein